MTFLYTRTNTWNSAPQPNEETIKYWKHISEKKNWRIVNYLMDFYKPNIKLSTQMTGSMLPEERQ